VSPRPRFAALAPDKGAAILRAAAEELSERGIEGASYNRIIARAGVSKGAMYYYFDDQWDLYATVVRDAGDRAAAAIGAIHPFDDAHSFWDAVLDWYGRMTAFLAAEPVLGGLLKTVIVQPRGAPVGEVMTEYMERAERAFHSVLEAGVRVAAIRDDIPIELLTRLAFAIGEALDRWTLQHWETLTPEKLEALPREMLAMHMRALAPLPLLLEWETQERHR
jgi:AcrR family transcriptional regulator